MFTSILRSVPVFLFAAALFAGCAGKGGEGKMPITTTSEKAMQHYLEGQKLADGLQIQESKAHFEQAVAEDPNFALGYLNLAFAQPSAKGFFDNFDKAKALADKASEGERLWIEAVDAGNNGDPMKQRSIYKKLVEMFPDDERMYNLLGTNYFGQQDFDLAVESYNKSVQLAPDFSLPYNMLGYSYRQLSRYDEAEKAFKKYVELIPNDPNPYDSYAELLLKIGKYDASISEYQKALEINPNFVASHIGIATNYNYKGDYESARQQLAKQLEIARDDGERRAAHFTLAVSYADEGNLDQALAEIELQFALAEKINDAAAMAGDHGTMALILIEMGKYDEAADHFKKGMEVMESSDLSQNIKEFARRGMLYNEGLVALKKNDLKTAKAKAEEFRNQVEAINNPNQIRLAHQLAGMIAMAEKDFGKAVEEFKQSNLQNGQNLHRLATAYEAKGDKDKAAEYVKQTAEFNALNSLAYSFVRRNAVEKAAAAM